MATGEGAAYEAARPAGDAERAATGQPARPVGYLPGDFPDRAIAALAAYPPVAACRPCREYAADHYTEAARWSVLAATLGYHDMSHQGDPLSLGCDHFGSID